MCTHVGTGKNTMKSALLILAFALTGCAHTSDGTHKAAISETYHSEAKPQDIAACIARTERGEPKITSGTNGVFRVDNHTGVSYRSQWEITPEGSGALIEFRQSGAFGIGNSQDRVHSCFKA